MKRHVFLYGCCLIVRRHDLLPLRHLADIPKGVGYLCGLIGSLLSDYDLHLILLDGRKHVILEFPHE
jgi:hypothetical protein